MDNGIPCDFAWVPGYLHSVRRGDKEAEADIARELAAAQSLGISAFYSPRIPLFQAPAAAFPHQALFHPFKYLTGLLRRMRGSRCQVFEHSAAEEILDKPSAVEVNGHRIRCGWVILATHNPLMGRTGVGAALLLQTKLNLYTSYALGGRIPRNSVPAASYWDTATPYHYLRVDSRRTHDYAILGGEDHKTGQGDEAAAYRRLGSYWRRLFPGSPVDKRWAGQVIETNDGLPYIGATADRQFAATGFAGNGMTFGTLGAIMACDAVLGRANPWSGLFDPHRKKLRGGTWRYIRENADYPYFMARRWLAGAEAKSLDQVRPGTGEIVRVQGKKVAAYRDPAGKLSLCSPICTHLQCIVRWNSADQTWDCPCHGSRFRATGEVISGPAEQSLQRLPAPRGQD
ncbi:MAG TPA: FAD-dependent oxidoreductase [Opitutaceae bacterium]|nr:FAD-dependent oxidoreductase [Opitutaceae bacterium]